MHTAPIEIKDYILFSNLGCTSYPGVYFRFPGNPLSVITRHEENGTVSGQNSTAIVQ